MWAVERPIAQPTNVRTAVQTPAPGAVKSATGPSGIRAMPAGMEISWRIAGIMRQTNVVAAP